MAISTTNSKKSLSLLPLVAIIITIHLMPLLLHRVNSQSSISIVFDGFDEDSDLTRQGNSSYSSTRALQLTNVDDNGNPLGGSVGRALYSDPVRLYDKSTGRVSFIHTSFIIEISAPSSSTPADGLAFFFAPVDSTIPPNSGGAFLGLFSADLAINNSRNEVIGFRDSPDGVVAVEFDTYPNVDLGDPDYRHIGIDVNSIVSVQTAPWEWQNGKGLAANVIYNPYAKTLRVYASYPDGSSVDFTHEIDLTTVLPEWVKVGFSGSTGLYSQINNVRSWAYNSVLVDISAVGQKGGIASVV